MSDAAASQPVHVQINFLQIREPADIGIRRASIFLGLATNAAATVPPLSHVLDDRVQYRFVTNEVSPETAAHFREEFTYWVMGNALRELVDAFSLFLIRCRPTLHLMETKNIDQNELIKVEASIEARNISQQYDEVKKLLGLDPSYLEMFETFRLARNCLAHRRGIVAAKRDVNTDYETFKLRWCFIGMFVQTDGVERLIDADSIGEGIHVEKGGTIVARLAWKEKEFPVGSQIRLSRHDLAEICLGVELATTHVMQKMHEFASAQGIRDADKEAAQSATEAPQHIDGLNSLERQD
jgi:hypothetical protein